MNILLINKNTSTRVTSYRLPATAGENLSRQFEKFNFVQPERKMDHGSQQAFDNSNFPARFLCQLKICQPAQE